jgi:peroxiredoxin
MLRIVLIAFSAALLAACSSGIRPGEFNIVAQVEGLPDGAPVYLQSYGEEGLETLDTAIAKAGVFEFTGSLEAPDMLYLNLGGAGKVINLFAENSQIDVAARLDSLTGAKISGSAVHEQFESFRAYLRPFDEKIESLSLEYNSAGEQGDVEKLKEIEQQYGDLQKEQVEAVKTFVTENGSSFVAPFVVRRYLSYDLEVEELDRVLQGLDASVHMSRDYRLLSSRVETLKKVSIGQPALDFSLADTTGAPLALSSFRGKYLLVDFWASWCRPCRIENPNVVRLYNEFNPKGFEILGVSFDDNRAAWVGAIQADGLTWSHVSDLQGWQSAAGQLYAVNSIPHTVLIDPDGVIIAKNLRGDALHQKLSEIFARNM